MFLLVKKEKETLLSIEARLNRSRFFGFCVVTLNPYSDGGKEEINGYWAEEGFVNNNMDTQYPKLYSTGLGLFRRYNKLKEEGSYIVRLAVWFSDDHEQEPLDKYKDLLHRWPGCPTQ